MKVLALTNMLPSERNPRAGTFVEQQIEGLRSVGLSVDVCVVDRLGQGMFGYRHLPGLLRRELVSRKPDVLHVMYGGVMGYLALKGDSEVPRVLSFCGTDLLGEQCGPVSLRLRTELGVWCSRRAALRADHIVVKSRQLEERLPAAVDLRFVSIVPNGVNLDRFRPLDSGECRSQLGWDQGGFHVLFSTHGVSDSNKRLPLAQKAVDFLCRDGVKAEIHIMENMPHDEVPLWLNAADVVLMTSMHEGSPNIVKEALACNRPVVSVDVGDVRERIDRIGGCFLAEATPADLAGKLAKVADGPREVASRETMEELSLERVANRLLEIYETAICRRNG